ncbi:hypothetical protein PGB90_007750 [Kerria lacca]
MAVPNLLPSVIIENLLETTNDKDEKVRNAVYSSLQKIAQYYPSEVVSASINYRIRNLKLNNQEVRSIYNVLKNVCEEKLIEINSSLIQLIINHAVNDSLKSAESPYISADILSVIGTKYCLEVYQTILKYMIEGVAPYASIIYIIGNLSIANMKSFLPLSKHVFSYLVSILPVTKTDNMRKVYATTICQLTESVIEQTPLQETCIMKEPYSSLVEEIFETFITVWLQIKDIKVCETVIQATGSIILLFNDQKLMNDSSRIINTFLGLYKKTPLLSRFVITQAISNFLSVVPRSAIQSSLDSIFNTLHVMVWITPDFTQPLTVKNHSEVLRCYDHIGVLFEDKLCEILLRNLRSNTEQDRVVALLVTSHLLNSSEQVLKPKISEFIILLRSLLDELSIKINKSLVKIIIALAYKEYLTEKDSVFIDFLAKHCHHTITNPDLNDLESMCKNTIYLLSTTITSVQPLCWKVLLHILINGDIFHSVSVFAKSLAYLVSHCDPTILDKNCYERSETVFVRVISLLGSPLHENRGVHLLSFLNDYVRWKIKLDTRVWQQKTSQLLLFLENAELDEIEWEYRLLDLLSSSFTDDIKPWLCAVNTETLKLLTEQQTNHDYNQNTNLNNISLDEQTILFKMLALLTQYMDDDDVVFTNIEKILSPINQRSLLDLKACSCSVGILSKTNFDLVFKQLEYLQKTQLTRKTTKFLGFLKDTKCETDVEIVRRMICECFSAMIVNAPTTFLLLKLKQLLSWFMNLMQTAKDIQTKNSCMEALFNVSMILLKSGNTYEHAEECRNSLIIFISNFIEEEKDMPTVICLKTVTVLFKLSTNMIATDKLQLLQKCLNKMFQYYSVSTNTACITECGMINEDQIIWHLCLLIEEIIKTKNSAVLEEIIMFLQPWLSHRIINHRMISIFLLRSTLRCYVDCHFHDMMNFRKYNHISSLLGRVYIRTFENNSELSHIADECVILLLAIIEFATNNVNLSTDEINKSMSTLKLSHVEFFRVTIYCKLTSEQLSLFTESLMNGLTDSENCCATETAQLLSIIFAEIGSQFQRQALEIFNGMLLKLEKLENEEIRIVMIKAILALARQHKDLFLNTMLSQALPFHSNICHCWHELSRDEHLSEEILKRLLERIRWNRTQENFQNVPHKITNNCPITAVAALKELLIFSNKAELFAYYFADLFSSLLMLISYYIDEKISNNGRPIKESSSNIVSACLAFDTLIIVMEHMKCKEIKTSLCSYSDKIDINKLKKKSEYYELLKALARIISDLNYELVMKILVLLNDYVTKDGIQIQRDTVVIFFVEIFNSKYYDDFVLVDTIINTFLHLLNDSSSFIRETSLKGLITVTNLEFALIERYKERILSALMQGLDDSEAFAQPGIIIQSLTGLSKMLPFLNNEKYESVCTSMAIRIKPFFEKEDIEIRCLSLKFFGELAHTPIMESSSFSEQVNRNLVCFLFHLGEKEPIIVQVCKFSLRAVSSLLKSQGVSSMINKHLIDDAKLHYQDYIIKITEILAKEVPEMSYHYIMIAISYTKSTWAEIRAIATIFIGTIYQNQEAEFYEKLSADNVSNKLLFLLKDVDANVRANAAIGLGLLLQTKNNSLSDTKTTE